MPRTSISSFKARNVRSQRVNGPSRCWWLGNHTQRCRAILQYESEMDYERKTICVFINGFLRWFMRELWLARKFLAYKLLIWRVATSFAFECNMW
jgi:hypothetical protein